MIKLFFAIIFVFHLLGKLLPSLNNIVQNILQSYITDFSGLHNLSLVIKSFIFGDSSQQIVSMPAPLLAIILVLFTFSLILKLLKII
ncbi:hypothetical protein [Spiroplasma endosymbiont of Tricholauxania praeusta]|uniref:hypothetical protein n=1 Tax=Spiroplasma endosymbiont of Tricholauxania praeusta TaxID=3066296 RepID=UPI0030CEF7ED